MKIGRVRKARPILLDERAKSKDESAINAAEQKAEGKSCLHNAEPQFGISLRSSIKDEGNDTKNHH